MRKTESDAVCPGLGKRNANFDFLATEDVNPVF